MSVGRRMRWQYAAVLMLLAGSGICQDDAKPPAPMSEDDARILLYRRLQTDALYGPSTSMDCVQFHTERRSPRHFDFIITLKTEEPCAQARGPYTGVDEFRVFRGNGKLMWYFEEDARYVDYERAKDFRKR